MANFEALQIENASLSFSLLDGLQIDDLRVVLSERSPLFGALPDPADREVLRVARARVRLHRGKLLLGRAVPVEIQLEGAKINIVRDLAGGQLNWNLLPKNRPDPSRRMRLPLIIVTNAELKLSTLGKGGRRLLEFQLNARGEQIGDEFAIEVVDAKGAGESLGGLRWNPQTGQLVADLEWTRTPERAALECALEGRCFAELCERIAERIGEEEAPARAAGLLADWQREGLLAGLTVD